MINLSKVKVTEENKFAVASAKAMVEKLGTLFNPFFIYGEQEKRKALLEAIQSEIFDKKIIFVDAITFQKEFETEKDFEKKYLEADVFIFNDLEQIEKFPSVQRKLLYIVHNLQKEEKQIIIGSLKPTSEMAMDIRLKSRLTWGLTVDVGNEKYE